MLQMGVVLGMLHLGSKLSFAAAPFPRRALPRTVTAVGTGVKMKLHTLFYTSSSLDESPWPFQSLK